MTQKIKGVNNVLTIVAIFAALAEVVSTVTFAALPPTMQSIFIWFVMFFPVLLILSFFLTLNFNPRVIWAPSDFQDEKNFLELLAGSHGVLGRLKDIETSTKLIRERIILDQPAGDSNVIPTIREKTLSDTIDELAGVENSINAARASVEELTADIAVAVLPRSELQRRILLALMTSRNRLSFADVVQQTTRSPHDVRGALDKLIKREIVKLQGKGQHALYSLCSTWANPSGGR